MRASARVGCVPLMPANKLIGVASEEVVRRTCAVHSMSANQPRDLDGGPPVNELLLRSAVEEADLVRRKEISARDLAEIQLDWVEAANLELNAVVELRGGRCGRCRNHPRRFGWLFHGVPMTIRESFHVAGMRLHLGQPGLCRSRNGPGRDCGTAAEETAHRLQFSSGGPKGFEPVLPA